MRRRAELIVVLVLALTGCASVPTSGPVQHYQPQQGGASSGVQVAPLPPVDGATQLLIVEGFLHAMGTYQSNYAIARQYLTTQAAEKWRPESGMQVYADGYPPTETDQSVVLIAPLAGTVDAAGAYTAAGGQVRLDFGLVKNDAGQWRISNPPSGLLVSKYLFSTGFVAVDAYFASATGAVMMPEPRFVPVATEGLAMAVNDVLAGPSAWLTPLAAGRPEPSVRAVAVTLDSAGVAQVDLPGEASAIDGELRQQLLAELTLTLCGFDQVRSVQVRAGGSTWFTSDGRDQLTPRVFAAVDPAAGGASRPAYLVAGGHLKRQQSEGNWVDLVDVQADLPKVSGVAISGAGQTWAGVSQDGTKLISGPVDGKTNRTVRTGAGLLRPEFARNGELWSPATKVSGLKVYREGAAVSVSVTGVPHGSVVAFALAPDGDRAAAVLSQGGATTVGLLRVRRTETGVLLDGWLPVGLDAGVIGSSRILDLSWSSASDLALLRLSGDGQTSVGVASQDAAIFTEIGPGDASGLQAIAAVPGRPTLVVTGMGVLYRYDGEFNWAVASTGVDAAAYPG
ncbi:MAG: LpqB family beta-propeller domain-containing protein [Propionibacteriales bacterium]|nr:LpqB family beta-propeller domain-containing protein [Propionibacteriales bacterium]